MASSQACRSTGVRSGAPRFRRPPRTHVGNSKRATRHPAPRGPWRRPSAKGNPSGSRLRGRAPGSGARQPDHRTGIPRPRRDSIILEMRKKMGSGSVLGALAVFLAAAPLFSASRPALERSAPRLLAPEEIAALPRDGSRVILQPIVFDPTVAAPDFSSVGLPELAAGEYGLVQFAPGALAEKDRLEAAGVRFFGYIPDNAFQVKLTTEAQELLAKSPGVRWFGPYAAGLQGRPAALGGLARRAAGGHGRPLRRCVVGRRRKRALGPLPRRGPHVPVPGRGRWPRLRFVVPDSVRAAFVAAAAASTARRGSSPILRCGSRTTTRSARCSPTSRRRLRGEPARAARSSITGSPAPVRSRPSRTRVSTRTCASSATAPRLRT